MCRAAVDVSLCMHLLQYERQGIRTPHEGFFVGVCWVLSFCGTQICEEQYELALKLCSILIWRSKFLAKSTDRANFAAQ